MQTLLVEAYCVPLLWTTSLTFIIVISILAMYVPYWKSALGITLATVLLFVCFCLFCCFFFSCHQQESKEKWRWNPGLCMFVVVSPVFFYAWQCDSFFLPQKYWKSVCSRDVQCLIDVHSTQESSSSFRPTAERISEYLQCTIHIVWTWLNGL